MPLEAIKTTAILAVNEAQDIHALDQVRVHFLGKKGLITEQLKALSECTPEERPQVGQRINALKVEIQTLIADKQAELEALNLNAALNADRIDVTLPGRQRGVGHLHPLTKSVERISAILTRMGFAPKDGPEIEDDFHNFEALNIPKSHPAREGHDTFYFSPTRLLRTHTSNVQIREMEKGALPLRIFSTGRVYRCDSDVTHTPMFNQVEGLWLAEGVHFGHLKGVLQAFLREYFESEVSIRLRPSYFPFTEPSAEVDMSCVICNAKGCRVCKHSGWLEVLGCGMVHPNVLKSLGIDAEKYTGFAFGMGVERLTMLRYGIHDLRLFFENDVRFLQQF